MRGISAAAGTVNQTCVVIGSDLENEVLCPKGQSMRIRGNASRTASSWDPTGVTQESRLPCPRVLEMGRRSRKWRSRCSAGACTAWKGSARPGRGVSGGCTSLGRLSAQGKRIPCRQHDEGEERRFPARFSLWNMNRCNEKNRNFVFIT